MRHTPRIAQTAIAALAGIAIGGGGYALASTSTKPIHGCVVKSSHQLLVQRHCSRKERTLTWSQRGPAGPRGATGATGPAGGASDWAKIVGDNPASVFAGQNITVQRVGVGEYQVTAGGACANKPGAITASAEAPGFSATSYPLTEFETQPGDGNVFDVQVYNDAGGVLTPQDGDTIDVAFSCQE